MTILNKVQNPNMTLISLVSSIKFKICLLKGGMSSESSVMLDSFFKQTYDFLPKTGVINIYGPAGCGKTMFMSTIKHIDLDHDLLRTKEKTQVFMDMMKYAFIPLVFDNYEISEGLIGIKDLKELRVPFYIISNTRIDNLDIITSYFEFPKVPVEDFAKHLSIPIENAKETLKKTNGNMIAAKLDIINFKSQRDQFLSSYEYVDELINSYSTVKFIDRYLSEHGNTLGIIHENYPGFIGDDLESLVNISHSLSDSVIIDEKIYSEISWDLMPFFNVSACIIPCCWIEPQKQTLRPGSIWTKYSNMCMKKNRLKKLKIPLEYINLWVSRANSGEKIPFDSYDLDSINQLSLSKIKPKILNTLKKCLKETSK